MSKCTRFKLWLCGRQSLTKLATDDHEDVDRAVQAARELLAEDENLLKVEVHVGRAHVCSVGRGWMSRSRKHFTRHAA